VAYGLAPPSVRLVVPNGVTQPMLHNTVTAIAFGAGSKVLDTFDWHSEATNTTRITPTVAGWCDVWGTVPFASRNDYITQAAFLRMNGATAVAPAWKPPLSSGLVSSTTMGNVPTATLFFNGSSDYVELCGQHTNTAAVQVTTVASFQYSCVFELRFRMKP
jgi:hypothetical protein